MGVHNIIPLPGTKPTRLCLLTTLVDIVVYVKVHIFVLFCLNAAVVAAYKAASPVAVAPLALLILGAVQLYVPGVVPKALFAECGGPVWLVHEGQTLSQRHFLLPQGTGDVGQSKRTLLGLVLATAALAALFAAP